MQLKLLKYNVLVFQQQQQAGGDLAAEGIIAEKSDVVLKLF